MTSKETKTQDGGTGAHPECGELVARCRAGEETARRELYDRCHQRVYRLMVRMVDAQDAADLTQQVFLQLFRKISDFVGRSKFATWVYRLAVNEALQYLRREKRWKFQHLFREPASTRRSVTDRSADKELLSLALTRLDPELRSVFVLREFEDLSYDEIAAATDIPAGTVGSRLNRARRELQQHLIQLGWEF